MKLYENEDEASVRSAISRDYYACYHITKNYLIKNKRFKENESSKNHQIVKNIYKYSENLKEREIGDTLNKFRFIRNIADYNSEEKWTKDILYNKRKYMTYSKTIIKILEELNS